MKSKFSFLLLSMLILSLSASVFSQTSFAGSQQPESCPAVGAIQAEGVNRAIKDNWFGWLALNLKNKFGTPQEWSFLVMVGRDGINTEKEAIAKGNAAVAALSGVSGPRYQEGRKNWVCFYTANGTNQLSGWAVTPAFDAVNLLQMIREDKGSSLNN
jgi:hypothetical protein